MKWWPSLLVKMAPHGVAHARRSRSAAGQDNGEFHPRNLSGPPPGTEQDVAELHWWIMEQSPKRAALALILELAWASSDWGFDYYSSSYEHTTELLSLMCTSYAVFCLQKKSV